MREYILHTVCDVACPNRAPTVDRDALADNYNDFVLDNADLPIWDAHEPDVPE
jgi:hypothetical protein